ncbi:type III glutamate--ammonia ligase [Kineococcus rhizosphaerae]|uniref:Gamma-glutamylmethylamide synthetase n=1 Tax=Kineococcus rhizosphaerae TaxID=559628 RepID=A0A2T0R6E0_9ACTN|nr:type III glutamate--ammonia ligase [Kineococcus rhizosphaerae]PRY16735.1 gamma-glutamylmethylamide synthetase [Kineococcus rhizosphaerae]
MTAPVETPPIETAPVATTTPPPAPDSTQSLASLARADGVKYLLATFTTLTGKPCSKLVPVSAADELEAEGCGFAGYAAGGLGQVPADPDVVAVPDKSSYAPLPFVRPGLAMVHCDPHVNGVPYAFAPRVLLRRQLAAAADLGMTLSVGAEVEYFLVRRGPDGRLVTADAHDDADQPCYDTRGVTRMYDHLAAVSDAMDELGWGPYASDHEDGNGQFEQNFHYADALTTSDRVTTLRYVIQMLAEQRGMIATYMPKPFTDRTGSGMHLHLSLWGAEGARFPALVDEHGLGLSRTAYGFIAGLLEHAPAMQAVIAPTVNSYKRTGATSTASGATWAPRAATYGGNDRTHLVRVPDANRVELRAGDGAASSHLAAAVALGSGLDGIRRDLDPGAPGARRQDAPLLPRTLLDAVHALESDEVVTGVLDAVDPGAGVSRYYAELKREEFYAWHSRVSDWEVDRYLTSV